MVAGLALSVLEQTALSILAGLILAVSAHTLTETPTAPALSPGLHQFLGCGVITVRITFMTMGYQEDPLLPPQLLDMSVTPSFSKRRIIQRGWILKIPGKMLKSLTAQSPE